MRIKVDRDGGAVYGAHAEMLSSALGLQNESRTSQSTTSVLSVMSSPIALTVPEPPKGADQLAQVIRVKSIIS